MKTYKEIRKQNKNKLKLLRLIESNYELPGDFIGIIRGNVSEMLISSNVWIELETNSGLN